MIEELNPNSVEFGELHILKGDKGKRKGKYIGLFVMQSTEVRDKYFGSPSGEPAKWEPPDEVKKLHKKWFSLVSFDFTDYVVIGE